MSGQQELPKLTTKSIQALREWVACAADLLQGENALTVQQAYKLAVASARCLGTGFDEQLTFWHRYPDIHQKLVGGHSSDDVGSILMNRENLSDERQAFLSAVQTLLQFCASKGYLKNDTPKLPTWDKARLKLGMQSGDPNPA